VMALTLFRKSELTPPPDIEAASLRTDRFRLARETDWRRLESIVVALEKNRPKRISDDDLLALPVLYRQAASSLAVARETSLDAATLAYLEALVRRAWFQVYGPRASLVAWLRRFLAGEWSVAVRGLWLDVCIALFVMVAGGFVGWLIVARDPDWFYALVSGDMAQGRQPGAGREALAATLAGQQDSDGLTLFATYLFSHNTGVTILAFGLGFAFGIPTLLLLLYQTAIMGAMLWVFADAGLGWEFAGWLSIHGTTELGAILLGGAAGLHIGRAMAFPGRHSVLTAASSSGRRGAQVMVGAVLMLAVAGLLEGYGRQLITDPAARAAIGGTMALGWLTYFGLAGRGVAPLPESATP
jgi:uncharacterized membrane protein SpoIIM required for sporulation